MAEILPKSLAEVSELHSYHPDIVKLAKYGYTLLGQKIKKDPETIHAKYYCFGVNLVFYYGFNVLGYDPWAVIRTRGLLQAHRYLDLESDRGLILVDGAWQQFVPRKKRTPSLPKVAVGTAQEVVDLAANAGVKDQNLVYWSEDGSPYVAYEERGRLEHPPNFGDEMLHLLL